jgi:hypothetical protein
MKTTSCSGPNNGLSCCRRHAAGERANDAALDWPNIIAESKVQVAASWRIFT